MEAIKCCYASLWTPKAVAYRRKQNIDDLELLSAVIIMEMVEARSAGVAFSCDPQSGRRDIYVINANFGLGESVVSGAVEPDTYFVIPSVYALLPEIEAKKLGSKLGLTQIHKEGGVYLASSSNRRAEQALHDEDIKRLGNLITRVLDSLGNGEEPQDIEWAFDGNDFVLLQARPDEHAVRYFNNRPFAPLLWEKQLPENSPFKQAFHNFLKEYGHRGIYELDIINPRWQENLSYLLDIIRTTMATANLDDLRAHQKEKFNQAWAEIAALLPDDN